MDVSWYGEFDAALLQRAQCAPIGQRLLARGLLSTTAAHLFAPSPQGLGLAALRWPRKKLAALTRDLGALAFAPAIRAEIRREPVRRLRRVLGNGYLLALDQSVWDGRVSVGVSQLLIAELNCALDQTGNQDDALLQLFDRQGRNEARAAQREDAALLEWIALLYPNESLGLAHLPAKPVTMLLTHHSARTQT